MGESEAGCDAVTGCLKGDAASLTRLWKPRRKVHSPAFTRHRISCPCDSRLYSNVGSKNPRDRKQIFNTSEDGMEKRNQEKSELIVFLHSSLILSHPPSPCVVSAAVVVVSPHIRPFVSFGDGLKRVRNPKPPEISLLSLYLLCYAVSGRR